jgi:hypothetical protein
MRNATVAPGVRELLAGAFGDAGVDALTPEAVSRIVGCMFAAARRELDEGNPDQLSMVDPAVGVH